MEHILPSILLVKTSMKSQHFVQKEKGAMRFEEMQGCVSPNTVKQCLATRQPLSPEKRRRFSLSNESLVCKETVMPHQRARETLQFFKIKSSPCMIS